MPIKQQRKSINLYNDKDIRCYKVVFNITDEEDLLQWWEYQLENSIEKYTESLEFLHALYRSCFKILEEHKLHFDIIFEKSQNSVYWTLWGKELIELLAPTCKNCTYADCKVEGERVSFRVSQNSCKLQDAPILHKEEPTFELSNNKPLIIYDFLDPHDRETLIEINDELADILIYLENRGFSEQSVSKIHKLLNEYILVLSSYREIFPIKNSIEELAYFMHEHTQTLIHLDKSYVSLFEGLILNLQRWFDALFVTGASSIEAYRASIDADVKIIQTMTLESHDDGEIEFF